MVYYARNIPLQGAMLVMVENVEEY